MKKRSFFERLSGSMPLDDDFDSYNDDVVAPQDVRRFSIATASQSPSPVESTSRAAVQEEEPADGQLPVDVYQTSSEIVIRAFIAGVRADDINLSISRDMVVIDGSRHERDQVTENDYFIRELFWGTFSRTILLAQEIDVDAAAASSKDGLLSIVLPKLDKSRQTKLKVKAG